MDEHSVASPKINLDKNILFRRSKVKDANGRLVFEGDIIHFLGWGKGHLGFWALVQYKDNKFDLPVYVEPLVTVVKNGAYIAGNVMENASLIGR